MSTLSRIITLDITYLGSIFYVCGKMRNNCSLNDLILTEDNVEKLVNRNKNEPTPVSSNQLFKTQREIQIEEALGNNERDSLSPFSILSNQSIPDVKLTPKDLFLYWDLTYPAESGSSHKNYFNRTLKEQVYKITEVKFSEFEKIDKSDCYKVATLCKRLSRILERGLLLLAPHEFKKVSIESKPYLPSKFSPETLVHSCFMSELFSELRYNKPDHEKAFLKNMDLALGNLWSVLDSMDSLPDSIMEIFQKKNFKKDILSTHLIKSWTINEKVSYKLVNDQLDDFFVRYYSTSSSDTSDYSGKFLSHANVMWNYFLVNQFIYCQQQRVCGLELAENFRALIGNKDHFVNKIALAIEKLSKVESKLKASVYGETSSPESYIAKLNKFTSGNEGIECISINLREEEGKSSLVVNCTFLDITMIPEVYLRLGLQLTYIALELLQPNVQPSVYFDDMIDWFKNNNVITLMRDFEKLERILDVSLVPKFNNKDKPVVSFTAGANISVELYSLDVLEQYPNLHKYLKESKQC